MLKGTKTQGRVQRTVDELKLMSDEHLLYEIWMFYDAIKCISREDIQREDILRNAMIESFCIHARALIDFLYRVGPYKSNVMASEYFVNPTKWELEVKKLIEKRGRQERIDGLRARIHKRVAHLTWDRLHVPGISPHFNDLDNRRDVRYALALIGHGLRKGFDLCDRARLGVKTLTLAERSFSARQTH